MAGFYISILSPKSLFPPGRNALLGTIVLTSHPLGAPKGLTLGLALEDSRELALPMKPTLANSTKP